MHHRDHDGTHDRLRYRWCDSRVASGSQLIQSRPVRCGGRRWRKPSRVSAPYLSHLCSLVVPPVVAQGKLPAKRTRRARRCACPRRQHPLACTLDRKSSCLRGTCVLHSLSDASLCMPTHCLPTPMPHRAQPRALHAQAPLHCCRFPRLPASIALERPCASAVASS